MTLAPHLTVLGLDCTAVRPNTTRAPAYGPMSGPERCEGFFERTVSQPFVELVSFTRGPGLTGDTASGPLQLQAVSRAPLRVVVQPMRSSPYYRVDADLPAGQALRWDPVVMIKRTGVPASELGFLALRTRPGVEGSTAVAPLALSAAALAQPDAVAAVRASVPIEKLSWRSYRLGTGAAAPAWTDVPNSQRYEWQRVIITIPMPADGKGFAVDVQAIERQSGQALPMLRFTMLGPQDE
ncbi:MAG TPA: hypothetical protein VLJ62_30205 [Burkholderiaceae bacterium]|nr:hypothetical protein [Burkholderiaceae bacterium]